MNSSVKVERGHQITGKIGPTYEKVSDAYLYPFVCNGNNKYDVHCKIIKEKRNIIPYKGNYSINIVDNYSLYIPPKELKENTFLGINIDKNRGLLYFPIIIFVILAIFIFIFAIRNKNNISVSEISFGDSVDIRETAELNK